MESTFEENKDEASKAPEEGNESIAFEKLRDYCLVTFQPRLLEMGWTEVETATTDVVTKLCAVRHDRVVVDLSAMRMINSGLIASLIRIWKATQDRHGLFSVVSPNDTVTEVLKISGLWKLWSVAADREEATYEIGVSKVAIVERREKRTLIFLTLTCAIVSGVTLVPLFLGQENILGVSVHTSALLLSIAGSVFGLLSVIKYSGIFRLVSILFLLVAAGVLATLWFREHPFYFRETEAMYHNK